MSVGSGVTLIAGASVCAAAIAIVHSLLAGEIRAWLPYLARRLVRSAARRLPPPARVRYESDWLAELAAWEDRPLSALTKAAHLRWKANGIRGSIYGISLKGDRPQRILDLSFAVVSIVFFSPLLIACAVAIKLESRGPVFFRQARAGRDNANFALIKFRSMYVDPPIQPNELVDDGVMFKIRQDPRITRVGRFLRRYSLDELPQFFNVLRGDMSLVGPRPLSTAVAHQLAKERYVEEDVERQRSAVRPGLTGVSQLAIYATKHRISGFDEMLRLDAEYARSRSLATDLRLLVRTVRVVVRPPNLPR